MSRFEQFYSDSLSGPQVFWLPMRSSHLRIRLATTFNSRRRVDHVRGRLYEKAAWARDLAPVCTLMCAFRQRIGR